MHQTKSFFLRSQSTKFSLILTDSDTDDPVVRGVQAGKFFCPVPGFRVGGTTKSSGRFSIYWELSFLFLGYLRLKPTTSWPSDSSTPSLICVNCAPNFLGKFYVHPSSSHFFSSVQIKILIFPYSFYVLAQTFFFAFTPIYTRKKLYNLKE